MLKDMAFEEGAVRVRRAAQLLNTLTRANARE